MSAALHLPTEALRQLREVIPFRLRLAFNSNEIEEGNLRVVRDSAERAASEIEWSHKAWEQARSDLEAELQALGEINRNHIDLIFKLEAENARLKDCRDKLLKYDETISDGSPESTSNVLRLYSDAVASAQTTLKEQP